MSDSISRADAICEVLVNDGIKNIVDRIQALPSAEARQIDCTDFINWLLEEVMDEEMWELNAMAYGEIIARKLRKLGLLEVKDGYYIRHIENNTKENGLVYRPSANAVPIHEDGTLEVKVPNAQKVGRVLVMDADSHIGGGLFYPGDAEAEKPNMKSWNGLYIKVYADDDPQDKAEKLYQICDSNEELSEVAKCIRGYLDEPSIEAEAKCIAQINVDTEEIVRRIKEEYDIIDEWIPCSERLPSEGEEVFVYLWGDVPHLASVNSEGQWETDNFYLDADDAPKAWMPLPKPYREDG